MRQRDSWGTKHDESYTLTGCTPKSCTLPSAEVWGVGSCGFHGFWGWNVPWKMYLDWCKHPSTWDVWQFIAQNYGSNSVSKCLSLSVACQDAYDYEYVPQSLFLPTFSVFVKCKYQGTGASGMALDVTRWDAVSWSTQLSKQKDPATFSKHIRFFCLHQATCAGVATVCAEDGKPFTLSGCEPIPCETPADMLDKYALSLGPKVLVSLGSPYVTGWWMCFFASANGMDLPGCSVPSEKLQWLVVSH